MDYPASYQKAYVTGEELQAVIDSIEGPLAEFPRSHVIVALLSLSTGLMCPEVSEEDLGLAVEGLSEWLCVFLSAKYDETGDPANPGSLPKNKVN